MGLEYKIKFPVKDKRSIEKFLKRISAGFEDEVTIILEEDGLYFCDNLGDSSVASKLFYLAVKEALSGNDEITVSEL